MGLYIQPEHNLSVFDIEAYLTFDLTGIVVNYESYMNDKFSNRLRFSLAHELGHFFLHDDIYQKFSIDSLSKWLDFNKNIPEEEYKWFELQASEFAGRLLVPRERLIAELNNKLDIIQKNSLDDYLKTDPWAVLSRMLPSLRKPFGVSDTAIEIRVKVEGLWPPQNT